jgi:glycosyltransferase involved in cell wall biosynthesis
MTDARRVLYLGHTGILGGAERVLLDILSNLPDRFEPHLACPPGEVADLARALGVRYMPISGTEVSFRLHPAMTMRGLKRIAASGRELRAIIRAVKPDVIHANSVRAGLIAGLSLARGGPPVLAHVHDCLPQTVPGRIVRAVLTRRAQTIVCVSNYVAACLGPSSGADVHTLRNGVDLEAFRLEDLEEAAARDAVGVPARARYVIGVVGQITPWKAQDDAIRMLACLAEQMPDLHLLVVGEPKFIGRAVRYDNVAFNNRLRELALELGVSANVHFLGERHDVPRVLRALDVLLVPSWEDPFPRVVLEAMAAGTPVIATSVGGPAEVIENGRTGLLLAPRQPERWADNLARLLRDPPLRASIAGAAHEEARSYRSVAGYVERLAELYDRCVRPL